MATDFDSTINSLYVSYYGRPADPGGLAFWSHSLERANGRIQEIADHFANAAEAISHFVKPDATSRVTGIYQQLFGRNPDDAGLKYWTEAIDGGKIDIASAALEIMRSARGTDITVSHLRLDAAAKFTAKVAESGSGYGGFAGVEAARLLIKSITLKTLADDIDDLVVSSTKLADIATSQPKVIEALTLNTSLTGLLDTDRGKADPLNLVKTLASVAESAAGSVDALESLLRGGGMGKVLDVMPRTATLKDVQEALKAGGIAAAVEVVYPARPTPPVSGQPHTPHDNQPPMGTPTLSLADDSGVDATDHVTNNATINITGLDIATDTSWQYSLDAGKHWTPGGANNGVGLASLDLSQAAEGDIDVLVRQVDTAGNIGATSQALHFTYDHTGPSASTLSFDHVEQPDLPATDRSTLASAHAYFNFSGSLVDQTVEWQTENGKWVQVGSDGIDADAHTITIPALDLSQGDQTVQVRLVDKAGNASADPVSQLIHGPASGSETPPPDTGSGSGSGSGPVPEFTVVETASGLELHSNVSGAVWISMGEGKIVTTNDAAGGMPQSGTTTVGAQASMVTGVLKIVPTSGSELADKDATTYTLGSDSADATSTGIAYGFGGDDRLVGTAQADHLYGGTGADVLTGGAGADRFTIGDGDSVARVTITDMQQGTVTSVSAMDTIRDFNQAEGDRIFIAPGVAGYPDAHMTRVTTVYDTLDEFIQDADQIMGHSMGGPVLVGQVGFDTYVLGYSMPSANLASFDPASDMVFRLENTAAFRLDASGLDGVASLGSDEGQLQLVGGTAEDDSLNNNNGGLARAYFNGFAGNDNIVGTGGNDYIVGGAGGDNISTGAGEVSIGYASAADSNLGSLAAGNAPASFDTVTLTGVSPVKFHFTEAVQHVFSVSMAGFDMSAMTQEDLYMMLTSAYSNLSLTAHDAMLARLDDTTLLVVNNGDEVIDSHDIAIKLVGASDLNLLPGGDVAVFTGP